MKKTLLLFLLLVGWINNSLSSAQNLDAVNEPITQQITPIVTEGVIVIESWLPETISIEKVLIVARQWGRIMNKMASNTIHSTVYETGGCIIIAFVSTEIPSEDISRNFAQSFAYASRYCGIAFERVNFTCLNQ